LSLERAVHGIDPELALSDVHSMEQRIENSLVGRRSPALLAEAFAGIALLLTAIGTYGVLSYAVAQRRREIGVRMALGASPGMIRKAVGRVTFGLFALGAALGVAGAWATMRSMGAILFHVPAFSVPIVGATALTMGVIGLAATVIPAWRASRVSPAEALAE
jgi:ABC-type antimicrobial peptide transport system permease subunit